MKLIVGVALLVIIWIAGYYSKILPIPRPEIYQYITLFLIVIIQPLVIFLTIRRNYYSSNHLRETLEMELTPSEIKVTGQSFYLEIKWKKMFKIVETRQYFLAYQNNLSAIILPKKDFGSGGVTRFREILKKVERVEVKLLNS
jgi:hypothetical protein